jgi:hypothetical protein
MKPVLTALSLALVLLMPAGSALAYRRAAVAIECSEPPKIDGHLKDWNPGLFGVAPALAFVPAAAVVEEGQISGPQDFSSEIFLASCNGNVYVAGIVTDDTVAFERHGEMWRGDMFEVLLGTSEEGYLHVGINPAGDVFVFHSASSNGTAQKLAIEGAARAGGPGYFFELKIPLNALASSKETKSVPFNLAARDRDPGEAPPAHITWSGYRHNLRGSFGDLWFETAPPKVTKTWPTCPNGPLVAITEPLKAVDRRLMAGQSPVRLRMVNYQSAEASWPDFWTNWDLGRIKKDLDLAAKLKINSIRLFVFFKEFGGADPQVEMISRLDAVIRQAALRGMISVVSFFPFDKDFRPARYAEMSAHLSRIVHAFRGDPAIAMWDLMNEPDHMWMKPESGVKPVDVYRWGRHMAEAVRRSDPTHLITVGLAGHFAVNPGPLRKDEYLDFVDVVSIHWYFDPKAMASGFEKAKKALVAPVILQEFGASGLLLTEAEADRHYQKLCGAAEKAQLSGVAAWELFDHPVGSVGHFSPAWREHTDSYFGLLDAKGQPKRQAGAFCNCLTNVPELRIAQAPRRRFGG